MTTALDTLPARRSGLPPGALDRVLLAEAITFALTSSRAGYIETDGDYGVMAVPHWVRFGLDEPLVWRQGTWIDIDAMSPAHFQAADRLYDTRQGVELDRPASAHDEKLADEEHCGTGCCLAGWMDLVTNGNLTLVQRRGRGFNTRDVAVWQLVGLDDSGNDPEGLPDGVTARAVDYAIGRLFQADNDLLDVIAYADALLDLYGQEPLSIEPDGTFR